MNKTALRQLVISLLDDQNGISDDAYTNLQTFVFDNGGECDDIFAMATGTEGRWYIPEDHGIVA